MVVKVICKSHTQVTVCGIPKHPETCRVAALKSAEVRLSRRPRHPNGEGTGTQLLDHHQGSHPRDGAYQSTVQKLGHPVYRPAGLCTAPPRRMAGENLRSRRVPPSGTVLPAVRREPRSSMQSQRSNKTTRRSARRSVVKNSLTRPTLLESPVIRLV
jgi:hypothetical protein